MVCIEKPALQSEMQASSALDFRYFTCLLDKGHINIIAGGFMFRTFPFFGTQKTPMLSTG